MTERPVNKLHVLHKAFLDGKIDRRELMRRVGTIGLSAAGFAMFSSGIDASAQDATPIEATGDVMLPGGFKSMTREEYRAKLAEVYPFTTEKPSDGGTIVLGSISGSNLTTVNPIFANNYPTQPILALMFDRLVDVFPDPKQNAELLRSGQFFVPGLADWYEIAEDGKTYTFHLDQNATFHDGTPVTAHDLVMVCDVQANEKSGSSYTSQFLATLVSWTAIDDHTFQWETVEAFPQLSVFPNIELPVLPASIWGNVPAEEWQTDSGSTGTDATRVVGSGPFKFVEINEGEGTTTFVRNDDYWNTKPAIEKLIFQVWPDETASTEALRSGALDLLMDSIPPADVDGLQAEPDVVVDVSDTYTFTFMGYNLDPEKTTLFQDVRVRQALFYALDREAMVDSIMLGFDVVATGTQSLLSEAYAPDQMTTVYTYDVDKATQLLDDAGWLAGDDDVREKDGVKLSFEMLYEAGSATNDQIAAAVQDYWRQIGVDVRPSAVDFDTVLIPVLVDTFDFDMVMLGFDWTSPSADQSAMFGTDSHGGGFNFMKYSNPEYDRVAAEANTTLDPQKRFDLMVQASNIVNDDVPIMVMWFRTDRMGYNKRLVNFTPQTGAFLWSLPWVEVSE